MDGMSSTVNLANTSLKDHYSHGIHRTLTSMYGSSNLTDRSSYCTALISKLPSKHIVSRWTSMTERAMYHFS